MMDDVIALAAGLTINEPKCAHTRNEGELPRPSQTGTRLIADPHRPPRQHSRSSMPV
jgi:hypothetical protein